MSCQIAYGKSNLNALLINEYLIAVKYSVRILIFDGKYLKHLDIFVIKPESNE